MTVIQFPIERQSVQLLWSPKRGIKPAWRLTSRFSVVEFKPKAVKTFKIEKPAIEMSVNQELVREIEREIESIVDHYDQQWADGLDSYDYLIGEAESSEIIKEFCDNYSPDYIDDDSIDDGTEFIQQFLKLGLTKDQIAQTIIKASEIDTADIYRRNNEIASFQIGEYEYQLDVEDHEDLKALIAQASDADLKVCGARRESFYVYGRPCERIVWTVKPESLLDALNQLKAKGA